VVRGQGLNLMDWDLGRRVLGLGFGIQNVGFQVSGFCVFYCRFEVFCSVMQLI